MGKLSSIEDVEKRAEEEAFSKAAAATRADNAQSTQTAHARSTASGATQSQQSPQREAATAAPQQAQPQRYQASSMPRTADEELEFHGLNTTEKLGFGHTALVTIAVIALIAIVIYIANTWCHFF